MAARMECLDQDIKALYVYAQDKTHPATIRLAAAGTIASFLSSNTLPIEQWILDTLFLRMGLCLVKTALGHNLGELRDDVRLVKRTLSTGAIRRIEAALVRLTSAEYAGGAISEAINNEITLRCLYEQALAKSARHPRDAQCDDEVILAKVERLLA